MDATANPRRDWRVETVPDASLSRTEAGRFSLPVVVCNNGDQAFDLDLILTGEHIELMYGEMRRLLAERIPAQPPRHEQLDQ